VTTLRDIRSPLAVPAAYWLVQRLLGASAVHRRVVEHHARVRPGLRVLDIGCGPGRVLDVLPDVDYLGLDVSEEYIAAARNRYGDRAAFRCTDAASADLAGEAPFDVVLMMGVLHHLDDGAAGRVVALAADALDRSGRLVTLDPARTADQAAVARWLTGRDRGAAIRAPDAYRAIAEPCFASVAASVYDDLARVPYTHVVLECERPRAVPQTPHA